MEVWYSEQMQWIIKLNVHEGNRKDGAFYSFLIFLFFLYGHSTTCQNLP